MMMSLDTHLAYFKNSIDYNRLLNLKFNPFAYDDNYMSNNLANPDGVSSCNYIFDHTLDMDVSYNNGFSILHLNSRSLNKNQDYIDVFLSNLNLNFSIIAMSETWFKEDLSNLIDIPNYTLISVPRHNRRSGGVALYVHNTVSFKIRKDLNLIQSNPNVIDHSESVFIEIVNCVSKNIIVGCIYRAHGTDIDLFNSDLASCLDLISDENKLCYMCGDYNLDLLKFETDSKINNFLTNFYEHNMFPLIDRPTRITSKSATLIDNIFTNVFDNKIKAGICVSDITDHYPVYQVSSSMSIHSNPCKNTCNRSFSESNVRSFVNHLQLTDWNNIVNEDSVTQSYTLFIDKFTNLYDLCFPVRSMNTRKRSNRIPRKPWITSAILTSVRRKNKLHLKYKSSPTDSNKRLYVNYRNKLTNLIRISKKTYYCNLLDAKKGNLKQTWKILNGLLGRDRKQVFPDCFKINGNSISDSKSIADGFNEFFTGIGSKLANDIPHTNVSYHQFLKNIPSPPNSIFLSPQWRN